MEISTGPGGHEIELRRVFNGITLITNSGERMSICMRDSGFEFTYEGGKYIANDGVLRPYPESEITYSKDEVPTSPGPQ